MKTYTKIIKKEQVFLDQIRDLDKYDGNIVEGNHTIINPTEAQLIAHGYTLYVPPTPPAPPTPEEIDREYWTTVDYNEAVNTEIRKQYNESQEFALLRQRDTKLEDFNIYNNYCEECKTYVKNKFKEYGRDSLA